MTLSNKFFNRPSAVSKAIVAVLVLSAIGFADASYLTASHYLRIPLPCSIVNGCEKVTTSAYSTLFGVPIALFGAAYYLIMLVISVASLERKNKKIMTPVLPIAGLGFMASLILVYLQLFVLGSICLYCMMSAVTTILIFALAAYFSPIFFDKGEDDKGNERK